MMEACILPRLLLSTEDALYCAKWLFALAEIGVERFSLVACVDLFLKVPSVTPMPPTHAICRTLKCFCTLAPLRRFRWVTLIAHRPDAVQCLSIFLCEVLSFFKPFVSSATAFKKWWVPGTGGRSSPTAGMARRR